MPARENAQNTEPVQLPPLPQYQNPISQASQIQREVESGLNDIKIRMQDPMYRINTGK